MKTDTAFTAMQRMGYQAGTLGEEDFIHGLDFIEGQIKAHPGFFVSANVLDTKTGKPIAQPYVIRTYPVLHGRPEGKRAMRVAFLGLMGLPEANTMNALLGADGPKIRVTDPLAVARDLVPRLRAQADVIVVLAHADMQGAEDIAKVATGIDLIVVGHAQGIFLNEAPQVNGATLVANGDRARYAGQAMLTLVKGGPTRVTVRNTPISNVLPENPQMALLRDSYKARLAAAGGGMITENEITPVAVFFPAVGDNHYVGSSVCASCHAAASAVWDKSLHKRALLTLETTSKGINAKRPDCVRCHTVGFGQATGFRIAAPDRELSGVGCESCHGPGNLHVTRALAGNDHPGAISRSVYLGNNSLCIRCHDPANDPKFNFNLAIAKIKHWGPGFK